MLTLPPGPLTTSAAVKRAMLRDLGSRDGEFTEVVRAVRRGLLEAAGVSQEGGYEAVPMQGSGTFAVEAVLTCAGQPARRATGARLAGLTPREIEVLRLIAGGDTAKEAARKLDIAPKTADNHIQSLYSKIGVTTRAGAALFALEQGLVQ